MGIVGYVHFSGQVGDLVRIDAIRRFFTEKEIAYREFALHYQRKQVDIIREMISPVGLKHLSRKIFLNRKHPLLKEINWNIEIQQLQQSIEDGYHSIEKAAHDISIFHAETIAAGIVCLKLKESLGKPFVYDMHGIAAEEAKLKDSTEWMNWSSEWERQVIEAADCVLVVSKIMAKYVERVYKVSTEKICVIPNGSYVTERKAEFKKPITVIYAGNFAPYENIMEYIHTAEIGANEEYKFWMLGDGASRDEVFNYINTKFVDIAYWGRKPRAIALDYCARSQVGFVGQTCCADLEKDFPRQIGCPIKLFDYASCGLPVVAPPGEWSSLIEEADCGVIAGSCDAKAFVEAIRELSDKAVWERKSSNGKELIQTGFQWSQVLTPLTEIYKTII